MAPSAGEAFIAEDPTNPTPNAIKAASITFFIVSLPSWVKPLVTRSRHNLTAIYLAYATSSEDDKNQQARERELVTRQERIDDFVHDGRPPANKPLQVLCEDHNGTYLLPFLCQWRDGIWQNAKSNRRIEAAVVGWRAPEPV